MRPLLLKMTAFGPYKETEIIDFKELEGNKLFVVSGQTGSGKTTIFDGICFALYGSASGQDRDNYMMLRSDFAREDVHTAVELTFIIKDKTYRILRQLGHQKKGNKSKTGEKYEFYEQIDGKEVPCVDRQMVSEIDKKVEAIIGLTEDQFKQIVMLPQGEFRKLLTSQTDNKEAILRRLFKTESYKLISERLKQKKDDADQAYKKVTNQRDTFIKNIQATIPAREGSPLFQTLEEEYYNTEQIIEGLQLEGHFYEEKVEVDRKEYEDIYQRLDTEQTAFHQAKQINDRFKELEQKRIEAKGLDEQAKDYSEYKQQLKTAEKASQIEHHEHQVNTLTEERRKRNSILEQAINEEKQVDLLVKEREHQYNEEKKKEPERKELEKEKNTLERYLPIVKEMETQKEALKQLAHLGKETKQKREKTKEKREEEKKASKTLQEKERDAAKIGSTLADEREKLHMMSEKYKVCNHYLLAKEEQLKRDTILERKQTSFNKAKVEYEAMEQKWFDNQAHILASKLHEGESCPVCGSLEHPQKALTANKSITKEKLDAEKKIVKEKEEIFHTAKTNANANKQQLDRYKEEVLAFDMNITEVKETKDQIIEEGHKQREIVTNAESKQKEQIKLAEEITKVSKSIEQLESEYEKIEGEYQEQRLEYEKRQTAYNERIREIPEKLKDLSVLQELITKNIKRSEALALRWENAQKELQLAKEASVKTETALQNARKEDKETKEKSEAAIQTFQVAREKVGFTSVEEYNEAKLPEKVREELKTQIEQYEERIRLLKSQMEELEKGLKDKKQTNLPELEAKIEHLKQNTEKALNNWKQTERYQSEIQNLLISIQEIKKEVGEKEHFLMTITDLDDVIRGQNDKKISFERFLQIDYLEQIVQAANERLRKLSNGQFLLMRSDRKEAHGRQSGLSLDVYDAYTGQTRDVKTLSGGEKFNASLCLALGMSDIIQSFEGNISIKTMFIDEGFGSLDEESLHKAIDTLVDLQQSGRMIGVISHVEELKAMFPAVLEVKKTKEGYSQTQFKTKISQ